MLFNKLKEIFDHNDIVAIDITIHALGREPYELRFYPVYNDSYIIDFYYTNSKNQMLKEEVKMGWFNRWDITEKDIQIILKDSTHTIRELYDKYMEKHNE